MDKYQGNAVSLTYPEAGTTAFSSNLIGQRRTHPFIYFYDHERIQLKTGVAPLTLCHSYLNSIFPA
ncbi:hypothetical protein OBV_29230 [Oscillibacter valericigenes Sjm18-20]|nr:hypothetical protein OBV_29230 [Oscillibacter valericigenes Sjm18-20]